MKHILLLLLLIVAESVLFYACSSNEDSKNLDADSPRQQSDVIYTCPMHPSIISDHPGACPICGMALVRRSEQKALTDSEQNDLRSVSLSPAQRIMANVTTVTIQRRAISNQINAVGVVDFAEPTQKTISARFRGRVEKLIATTTGTMVRKGAPLFEIYSPALFATQQEYLWSLEAAKSGDPSQLKLAAAARERLLVNYGLTDRQIEDLVQRNVARPTIQFLAPFSGTIVKKQITEGQYVNEGDVLYELADLSLVWIYIEVSEADVRFVKYGQPVSLETDMYPGKRFLGKVAFVEPIMTPETRTVRVRTQFANPEGLLKPQMYVRAAIANRATEVLAVPVDAVIQTGRRSVVWVESRDNMFEPRDVATGARIDGYYEILSGLGEGEKVVASGGFLIDSESLLQSPATKSSSVHPSEHGQQQSRSDKASDADANIPTQELERNQNAASTEKHINHEESKGAGATQTVRIMVDNDYSPSTIHAIKGHPLRILFHRMNDNACSEEVVFKDFDIRKKLAPNAETVVEFTPSKSGTFPFVCGMGMLKGKLIVK